VPADGLDVTDPIDIRNALRSAKGCFIESGCKHPGHRTPGLRVIVRTETAFRLPLAAILLGVVAERVPIPDEHGPAIELALHEAVANAVMHGNLEIAKGSRSNLDDYGHFCLELERCLLDPVARARRVIVTAWWTSKRLYFAVSDEGQGFAFREQSSVDDAPHGRGLRLMRDLAQTVHWNQRQRRVILTFPMASDAAA
jgi:anti-sigma regulatory factor (Ser/Thr protein kinase)